MWYNLGLVSQAFQIMQTQIIQKYEEFSGLREDWARALQGCTRPDLFLTFDWFLSWWENLSQGYALNLILLTDEATGSFGIAPLMRRGDALSFLAGHEVTDYCDFLFPRGREGEFLEALLAYATQPSTGISCMELINLRLTSPTLSLVSELAPSFGFRCRQEKSEETQQLRLPASYPEYTAGLGRKCRHELRRKARRAEALPQARVERASRPEEVGPAMKAFIALHREGNPEKGRFWEKPGMPGFFRDVASRLAEQGQIELLSLYAGGDAGPVASLITAHYGRTVYFYNVAYAQAYAAASPGYYLFDLAIRQAIAEERELADFLRGREKYKLDFGARSSTIYSLKLDKVT
jgi:CelD/BcsL family acetyltransferase involved in cellulose biosynthesis